MISRLMLYSACAAMVWTVAPSAEAASPLGSWKSSSGRVFVVMRAGLKGGIRVRTELRGKPKVYSGRFWGKKGIKYGGNCTALLTADNYMKVRCGNNRYTWSRLRGAGKKRPKVVKRPRPKPRADCVAKTGTRFKRRKPGVKLRNTCKRPNRCSIIFDVVCLYKDQPGNHDTLEGSCTVNASGKKTCYAKETCGDIKPMLQGVRFTCR